MRTYAAREGYIPPEAMQIFEEIRTAMKDLPEIDPAERANCHAMAHAFAKVRNDVVAVDGHFQSRNTYHSWLSIGHIIIDVLPVAGGCPYVVDSEGILNPWDRIYIRDPNVRGKVDWEAVDQIANLLQASTNPQ